MAQKHRLLNERLTLVALPAEGAALGEPGLPSCGLAEHRLAAWAHNNSLGVAEHGCYVEASLALDIHEE